MAGQFDEEIFGHDSASDRGRYAASRHDQIALGPELFEWIARPGRRVRPEEREIFHPVLLKPSTARVLGNIPYALSHLVEATARVPLGRGLDDVRGARIIFDRGLPLALEAMQVCTQPIGDIILPPGTWPKASDEADGNTGRPQPGFFRITGKKIFRTLSITGTKYFVLYRSQAQNTYSTEKIFRSLPPGGRSQTPGFFRITGKNISYPTDHRQKIFRTLPKMVGGRKPYRLPITLASSHP